MCAVEGSIPICSRAGYQATTILQQSTTCIQIRDTGRIVKAAFFPNRLKCWDFGYPFDICKIAKLQIFSIYMYSVDIWFSIKISPKSFYHPTTRYRACIQLTRSPDYDISYKITETEYIFMKNTMIKKREALNKGRV